MTSGISRRRTLRILGAAAGLSLLPSYGRAGVEIEPVVWHGHALGAPTTLILNHPDRSFAKNLISRVVAEARRLEDIFSLYRSHSELCELNRVGALAAPSRDLVAVLEASREAWEKTNGIFEPSIQPLWALYARHFSKTDAAASGPSEVELEQARTSIGFQHLEFSRDRIVFKRPGMALTLNGIAQGYVTDRVVALMRESGIESSLVDMGESYAIGTKPDGSSWRIGLAANQTDTRTDKVLSVVNKAVATSSFSGFHFDNAGRFSHILDPRNGKIAPLYRRVTVIADNATQADAYSTAFGLIDPQTIQTILAGDQTVSVDALPV
jgi:FAD:protein FMN transferase